MSLLAKILCGFVALQHVGFFVLESILFTGSVGRRIFALTAEDAQKMKPLALNQGVYNLFLTAGLVWAIAANRNDVATFFAACVVVAGVVGGLTAKRSILVMQGVPGAAALAATLIGS